jgi:hypothetical protein
MTKLSVAISAVCALALALVCPPSAPAQAKAQTPAQALLNLYQAAQQIIKDPAGEYEKGENPDFPYPSQIQAQWDASMAAYGNDLSTQERKLFPDCAAHLNAAITDMEIGYRIQISQPSAEAQQTAQTRFSEAPGEVAQCSAAIELAQSEVGSAPSQPQQGSVDANGAANGANGSPTDGSAPSQSQQGGVDTNGGNESPTAGTAPSQPQQGTADANGGNGSAIAGSATEAALPGSIDWTPALEPLQTYLANEWQRTVNDPKNSGWAADNAGNTLTLKLQPGQVPEVLSETGSRDYVFNNIMQDGRLPATTFPNGSTLTSVSIAPTFFVKNTPGKVRTRLKYYERDGIFKSYRVAQ